MSMPISFENGSGCVAPDKLQTGDLLFVGRLDAPTLLGKPIANASPRSQQSFADFLQQLFSLETLSYGALRLTDKPSVMDALKNHLSTVALGYYSGHVAMVIVENGIPYVIQAGTQDYDNYRVAIHPYYIPTETVPNTLLQMRGWANRRWFQYDRVWVRRANGGLSTAQKSKLSSLAKSYLGRPYGILDSLRFADDNRFYCSDYIYRCYLDALGIDLAENRTWEWFFNSPTLNFLNIKLPVNNNIENQIITLVDATCNALKYSTSNTLDAQPSGLSMPMMYYSNQLMSIDFDRSAQLCVKNASSRMIEYGIG